MTDIQTMRERILETNLYNSEVINFNSITGICTIYWVPAAEEWLLLDTDNGVKDYTFGSLEELLECIPDAAIEACYTEDIAHMYDEEEVQ